MSTDTTTSGSKDSEAPDDTRAEELRWSYAGSDSDEVPDHINAAGMRRRLPRLVRHSFTLAWHIDRRATTVLIVCQVLSGLLSALGLFVTTRALQSVLAATAVPSRLDQALPSVIVLAASAGLRALLGIVIQALSQRLSPRMQREVGERLLAAGTRTEMATYDRPGFADQYDQAERGVEYAQVAVGQTQNLISSAATLVSASVVIGALYPLLLPLLVLVALPQAAASLRAERVTYTATVATFRDRRVLYLLRWFMVAKEQADQIRTDTMAPVLLGHYRAAGKRVERTANRAVAQRARITLTGALATGMASALLWAVLWLLLDTGRISTAVAGTAVFALRSAFSGLQGIVGFGSDLLRTGYYLDDADRFVQEAQRERIDAVRGTVLPARPQAIVLRDVTFCYPGSNEPTLHGIDFQVRRGEVVAVIGENGCGKTTLMKLLCGLNLPTSGTVTWDDVPVQDLDPDAMWRLTSVVPQEFARWPLTCRDNISLGQPGPEGDAAVHRAAAASGADDVITSLRSGLDTLLAREIWGGQALSSGQFQRLAVARAMHRDGGLLVMDEPTSDLDTRAEHRIFTGLRNIARDRAVVLVTHNLGNTAVADRIVCMDKGRIVQQGTFAELVQADGPFRSMWLLRADREIPGPRPQG